MDKKKWRDVKTGARQSSDAELEWRFLHPNR